MTTEAAIAKAVAELRDLAPRRLNTHQAIAHVCSRLYEQGLPSTGDDVEAMIRASLDETVINEPVARQTPAIGPLPNAHTIDSFAAAAAGEDDES